MEFSAPSIDLFSVLLLVTAASFIGIAGVVSIPFRGPRRDLLFITTVVLYALFVVAGATIRSPIAELVWPIIF